MDKVLVDLDSLGIHSIYHPKNPNTSLSRIELRLFPKSSGFCLVQGIYMVFWLYPTNNVIVLVVITITGKRDSPTHFLTCTTSTLPETNSSHLKTWHPKRKSFIFQPSFYRCALLVSGRVFYTRIIAIEYPIASMYGIFPYIYPKINQM